MRERGIIFSTPMVKAILEGRKTQTRRIVKPQPLGGDAAFVIDGFSFGRMAPDVDEFRRCPYGKVGDRLWVRENYWLVDMPGMGDWPCLLYEDEFENYSNDALRPWLPIRMWESDRPITSKTFGHKPSIHMPRWASRITLEIVSVRVERLREITPADIIAEGCPEEHNGSEILMESWYADLWNSLHGDGAWELNPWVWVIEFKSLEAGELK